MIKFTITALAAVLVAGCGNSDRSEKEIQQDQRAESPLETMTGAYAEARTPNGEELTLFEYATEGLTGVRYTPESVSTQVVAGTNYRFVCTAQPAAQNKTAYRVEIVIYRPLPGQGEPRITLLKPL
ncbi:hypothetical protein [Alistipes sp.]|uniref:hypothetical protein n=1 Tax=Alistipes sp. TaxID=1872444 RepID=UPI003AF10EEC